MRNLKLLKSLRSSELQAPGSPQYLSVRADTGTLLVLSQYSITEFNPRTGQVSLLEAVCSFASGGDGVLSSSF